MNNVKNAQPPFSQDIIDGFLLGYVLAFRFRNNQNVLEISEACKQFLKDMGIGDYPLDECIKNFYRIYIKYLEFRQESLNTKQDERKSD